MLTSEPSFPFPAPTHNLTLGRTAREIIELDHKLHDAYPNVSRPTLPIDASVLPQPTKRNSTILNTLSRLASPAGKSTGARYNTSHSVTTSPGSPIPSTLPAPIVSLKAEIDPFFDDMGGVAVGASNSVSQTITGLAAYLTTLSNDQVFRQARPWKRFVRVRTDDYESVRVERVDRATKRVRSDIAAHISSPSTVNVMMDNSSVLHDAKRAGTVETHQRDASLMQANSVGVSGTETTSASAPATGNDYSVNIARVRKKYPRSSIKEHVSRNVQVSDFQMMRVLSKTSRGKVLLVRHKSSSGLYSLRAFTKRHVLVHQELEHTLTEQAVLRRMAAEGMNPFVDKLRWSFHDKENLFLVMVRVVWMRLRIPCVQVC